MPYAHLPAGNDNILGSGGQGTVKREPLEPHGTNLYSAFEARMVHNDRQVALKKFPDESYAKYSMQEVLAGAMLCSATSPCPEGLPFVGFLGVNPHSRSQKGAERLYTIVLERARNGDLTKLLEAGRTPAVQSAWNAFASGNSLIPGGGPELASARDLDAVLALLQQMAIGLQHMKERGIMHRCVAIFNCCPTTSIFNSRRCTGGCLPTSDAISFSSSCLPASLPPLQRHKAS